MPDKDRVLLSVPLGGLNDTLCQLEKAFSYAEFDNRVLVLHTPFSGLGLDFARVFELRGKNHGVHVELSLNLAERLDHLDTSPKLLQGQIASTFLDRSMALHYPEGTRLPYRISKSQPLQASLIVHHQSGGGDLSQRFLSRITLSPMMRVMVRDRIASLPRRFQAVHFRATDYTTDIDLLVENLKHRTIRQFPLVVVSDNNEMTTLVSRQIPNRLTIPFLNGLAQDAGRPLHAPSPERTYSERLNAAADALASLLVLAQARRLFIPEVQQQSKSGSQQVSGFSRLGSYLQRNRGVRTHFFGRELTWGGFMSGQTERL